MAKGLTASALGLLVLGVSACGGGGDGPRDPSAACRGPKGTLRLSIAPAACASLSEACSTIEVVAKSPQISSLIAQGNSPCTSTQDAPQGCAVGAELWTYSFCLAPSACGAHDFPLPNVFAPVGSNPELSISDTVSYCPVDEGGFPVGNCAGTIVDQCNEDAVTTVLVNTFTPPPSIAAVTFSSASGELVSKDQDGWKYCDVHASGTAKGPEGAWFYPLSNPIFADSIILDCGSWTQSEYGCTRAAGQPETTSWSRTFDDLWINPNTYPSGREVTVTGQVQASEYGTVLASKSTTVTCGQ